MIFDSVTKLNQVIKQTIEYTPVFQFFELVAEISNFKRHSKGHLYFSLKDENASISAMMFRQSTLQLDFNPKDGDHVKIEGKLNFYEPTGQTSIQVFKMTLSGTGNLYLQYEALKKELTLLGYFDANIKKTIPKFPKKIGVITSPTGAVIQDIYQTVQRRYPFVKLILFESLVQGSDAKTMLKKQIELADQSQLDVIILGRGGGSIEDLWPFNERMVVEAIYRAKTPIITAIGHETDVTLSDFVADLRAPTPTAAAELSTPDQNELKDVVLQYYQRLIRNQALILNDRKSNVLNLDHRLEQSSPEQHIKQRKQYVASLYPLLDARIRYHIENKRKQVLHLTKYLISPQEKILYIKQHVNQLILQLTKNYQYYQQHQQEKILKLSSLLKAYNPLAIMDKGFVLVKDSQSQVLSYAQIKKNDTIHIQFKEGVVKTSVLGKENNNHE